MFPDGYELVAAADGMQQQILQGSVLQGGLVGRHEIDERSHVMLQGFLPTGCAETPPVSRLETGKTIEGHRRGEIVSHPPGKIKKLAGGGYFKIINQSVPSALRKQGYNDGEIHDIIEHIKGSGSLEGTPWINRQTLMEKGFTKEELDKIDALLPTAFDISFPPLSLK